MIWQSLKFRFMVASTLGPVLPPVAHPLWSGLIASFAQVTGRTGFLIVSYRAALQMTRTIVPLFLVSEIICLASRGSILKHSGQRWMGSWRQSRVLGLLFRPDIVLWKPFL